MLPGNPLCPYCGDESDRVTGAKIYPRRVDLHLKTFYYCDGHKTHEPAYVGCHPNSDRPLGRLADAELRKAKSEAHRAFDPLWRDYKVFRSRSKAYRWLSDALGVKPEHCHIGMFDVDMCRRVVEVCREKGPNPSDLFDALFD